jgi:hypothetical protein
MVVDKSSGRVRGGRDQFNWDTIEDKYRENYLGHSLKAPRGKWQEGKDLIWYTKKKPGSADDVVDDKQLKLQQEIAMVQQKEAELLLAAQAKPAPSTMDMFKKFVLLSSEEQQKVNKQVIRYDTTTRAERREENSDPKVLLNVHQNNIHIGLAIDQDRMMISIRDVLMINKSNVNDFRYC